MVRFFFLPSRIHLTFLSAIIVSIFLNLIIVTVIILIAYFSVLFMFRGVRINHRDKIRKSYGVVLSPINGIVHQFKEIDGEFVIVIRQGFWHSYSLNLPFSSEVQNRVDHQVCKKWRYSQKTNKQHNILLELAAPNKASVKLGLTRCLLSLAPRVWTLTGDRGRVASCFGYMPFGGTVTLYLPSTSKVMIQQGERLLIGETVIASIST